jgi:putative spermidine/putrescine transport system substrate-binding protein
MNKFQRTRRSLLALGGLAAAVPRIAWGQAEPAKPAQIVVNDSGGDMQAAMRRRVLQRVREASRHQGRQHEPGRSRQAARDGRRAATSNGTVTEIDGEERDARGKAGLLEPLDLKIVDLSQFPKHLQNRKYRIPKGVYSTVMGYGTDVFPEGKRPQSWADFWDVQKFPGRGRCAMIPADNLEFALLADGVALDKIYPIDVDRAFKKMDQIKKHVSVWWTTGGQSAQVLVDKEAVIGTAWNGRYYTAIKQGAPIAIGMEPGRDQGIVVSAFRKGAKDVYWAQKMLAIIAEPKPQEGVYAEHHRLSGLNLEAIKYTDPKLAPYLPTNPANLPKQFWTNVEWHAENAPEGEGTLGRSGCSRKVVSANR